MDTIDLSTSTALVTGANRGFGRHLAEQLVARGAKVYAAARRPETVDLAGVTPLRLDITDPASVAAAAALASDVTLLDQQRRHLRPAHRCSPAISPTCAGSSTPTSSARST